MTSSARVESLAAYRTMLLDRIVDELEARVDIVDPGWDGSRAISQKGFVDAMAAARALPLPEVSDRFAEVVTPARIHVRALCPRCHFPTSVSVELTPELVVDDDGAEIKVKSKTKAIPHVCGQTSLDADPEDDDGPLPVVDGPPPVVSELEAVPDGFWATDDDDRCGEETRDPDADPDAALLVCERILDHDGPHGDREAMASWVYVEWVYVESTPAEEAPEEASEALDGQTDAGLEAPEPEQLTDEKPKRSRKPKKEDQA